MAEEMAWAVVEWGTMAGCPEEEEGGDPEVQETKVSHEENARKQKS